jgi:FtsH-binding integral membrane protein
MASRIQQKRPSIVAERAFFLSMTAVIFALVLWGFAKSFYLRTVLEPPPTHIDHPGWLGWMFIVHGLLFTLWLGLFVTQAVLIGSKRLPLHKRVGKAAWPLYFAVLAMGLHIGWLGAAYGFHDVPFDSVTFSALPWLVIIAFAILCGLGLRERRDPQRHKRLMLLGTLALSDAGIARVAFFYPYIPSWVSATVFLLVPVIIWDLVTRRRIHSATILGSFLIILALALSVPIGGTEAWHAFVTSTLGIESVPPIPPA